MYLMRNTYDMNTIEINNVSYHDVDVIKDKNPEFGKRCPTLDKIVIKYNIPENQYIYVSKNKQGFKVLAKDTTYKAKKLLVSKKWLADYLLNDPKSSKKCPYPSLPNIIELEDNEYFMNEKNEKIHITVRGERHPCKIFFKAKDVGEMLALENFRSTLRSSGFEENTHYTFFKNTTEIDIKDGKTNNTKSTYLTYVGLVRLLFVRRHPISDKFVKWTTDTLFAMHFGTRFQKQELASNALNLSLDVVQSILNTNVNSMPVIYLLELGKATDIRDKLELSTDIPSDTIIFKFGFATDAKQRFKTHDRDFKKLGITPHLKYHTYVDPVFLSTAETRVKNFFQNGDWIIKNHPLKELAYMPPRLIYNIKDVFEFIGTQYAGKIRDIQNELNYKREKLEDLQARLDEKDVYHNRELVLKDEIIQHMKQSNKDLRDMIDILRVPPRATERGK